MLRNSKWTLTWNNFCRGLALVNCCESLGNLHVFTPLYRGMKETLLIASTSKESLLKLDNHQWYVAWFCYCPMRNNFKSIPCIERNSVGAVVSLYNSRHGEWSSGCTIVLLSFFLRSSVDKHPMPSNSSKIAIAPDFHSFCTHRHEINNF